MKPENYSEVSIEISLNWYCTTCTRLPIHSNLRTCHSSSYLSSQVLSYVRLVLTKTYRSCVPAVFSPLVANTSYLVYLNHHSSILQQHLPLFVAVISCTEFQTFYSQLTLQSAFSAFALPWFLHHQQYSDSLFIDLINSLFPF